MSSAMEKAVKKLQTDVLVVGGGTAGFVAAIAAARNGAKVTLVEQRDHLGSPRRHAFWWNGDDDPLHAPYAGSPQCGA